MNMALIGSSGRLLGRRRNLRIATRVVVAGVGVSVLLASAELPISPVLAVANSEHAVASESPAPDPVVAAAGDIACDPASTSFNGGLGSSSSCKQMAVSDLMLAIPDLGAVLPLGDAQYADGTLAQFQASYDPSWGRLKSITRPVPGNHEYHVSGAAGYFSYFGARGGDPTKGYYSYDLGSWHVVALNSNCSKVGGCGSGSAQLAWLKADLAAHPTKCTLAYWHHPIFSSGQHGNSMDAIPMWDALAAAGADLVLNGHDHQYERFAPQTSSGVADPNGIRQFVVGTGGSNHTATATIRANSQVRNSDTFGVLKLTLRPDGYDWRFLPEPGRSFSDSGSEQCETDTTAPLAPTGVRATDTQAGWVSLTWDSATDDVGVISYTVLRDSVPIGTTTTTSYVDTTAAATTAYSYTVTAADAAGNTSPPSEPLVVTTQGPPTILSVTPDADAYVSSGSPTSRYGTARTLQVDMSPSVKRTYVRFAVAGVSDRRVLSAILQLNTVDGGGGGDVHVVRDTSWTEAGLTWDNQPTFEGASLADLGSVTTGQQVEVDLTSSVTGDGTYSFVMLGTSSNGADYTSREGGSAGPRLVISVASS
jgi:hypothetical protein